MLTACSDTDDYSASTTQLLTEGSVVTGSSDVTATTATFHGTVTGLEKMNTASYTTGFKYGYSQNALTETASAASAAEFSASLSGLVNNTTIYYQAFVTLQGRLTYTGEVKSLITTDATATTGDATGVDYAGATLAGTISKYPADAKAGIVIAASDGVEAVRSGLRLTIDELADNYAYTQDGLLPNTTYYYAAFLDLGAGVVYGDVKSFTTDAHAIDVDEEFVDLGLSVKWAKHNIGAKKESDFGGYFAFGDLTGVNPSIDPADYAAANTYKTALDLAYQVTAGKGTLPTADQFEELFRLCTVAFVEQDGVPGYMVTAKNGNSIFLPAAGKRVGHDSEEASLKGYYLTGSVNNGNSQYAVDYEFSQSGGARATRATYEALSVRPVTTARNVKFDKTLLCKTWHFDLRADGSTAYFAGPLYYYGTADSWGSVTNGETVVGDTWNWSPAWSDIGGWIGFAARDYGTMTFTEDGKVTVVRIDAEGNAATEEGTYTLNEADKTISLSIDILGPAELLSQAVSAKTDLKILSMNEESVQIAVVRANDPCLLSLNYASDNIYSGIAVSLLAVGSDWGGTWGSQLAMLMPQELNGTHTVTYEGAVNGAMVTLIDFVSLKQRYPNAFVRIDDIKLDGQSIKFNANNFCYGDIEDNGNFRIEMFNIWGKGAENGLIKASPFSNLSGVDHDDAFTFANSIEITFTIITDGVETTYRPNLITINPSWGGPWDYNDGAAFDVKLNAETGKYELSQNTFSVTYNSADHAAGSIMTFIQVDNLYAAFPGAHATLNSCKLDGQSVSFDATKVLDSSEGGAYRLELWNMYGATSQSGCGFGTPTADGVITGLGFSSTMQLDFTINSLFAVPQF